VQDRQPARASRRGRYLLEGRRWSQPPAWGTGFLGRRLGGGVVLMGLDLDRGLVAASALAPSFARANTHPTNRSHSGRGGVSGSTARADRAWAGSAGRGTVPRWGGRPAPCCCSPTSLAKSSDGSTSGVGGWCVWALRWIDRTFEFENTKNRIDRNLEKNCPCVDRCHKKGSFTMTKIWKHLESPPMLRKS